MNKFDFEKDVPDINKKLYHSEDSFKLPVDKMVKLLEVSKLVGRISNKIDLETVTVGKTQFVRSKVLDDYIFELYTELEKAN